MNDTNFNNLHSHLNNFSSLLLNGQSFKNASTILQKFQELASQGQAQYQVNLYDNDICDNNQAHIMVYGQVQYIQNGNSIINNFNNVFLS